MNTKFLSIALTGAILLSGCSSKDVHIAKGKGENMNSREMSVNQGDGYTKAGMINSTNTKLLQAAAEETSKSGYQYFSFTSPAVVANANINTTDAFLLKCASKSVGASVGLTVLTLGMGGGLMMDDCDMFGGATGIGKASSSASFTLHKEKPTIAALDANLVLSDLKSKQLYKENTGGVEYSEVK
ncbi:MAG: hypothetical protein M0P91_08220 [Sulfuricurvum sp.]|jgi:hypothetical protein|uniref:hypothetical protein n=1 Tax=Sulfuricurvum sp. TaxID=2025608 RepID=UPI0025D6BCBF|nr:hypothetical protein [Sulfuricurvum sp.]MCK9373169.1 hypothetical protein [Sulfuricurvum sp.]